MRAAHLKRKERSVSAFVATLGIVSLAAGFPACESKEKSSTNQLQPTTPEPKKIDPLGQLPIEKTLLKKVQPYVKTLRPTHDKIEGSLEEPNFQDFPLILKSDRCYRIAAYTENTIEHLNLTLFSNHNVALQHDGSPGEMPILGLKTPLCPNVPSSHRLRITVVKGAGKFVARVFDSAP